jgi:uncharacterized protein
MNLKPLVHTILEEYALSRAGTHGVSHWARVLENGLRLAHDTAAIMEVVQLFAIFHDSRRLNEEIGPWHGERGAQLAVELRGKLFDLPDEQFNLLCEARVGHTDGLTEADITIQTCWDADRLDLGRVGIYPEADRLCTAAAKTAEMILWADERADAEIVPELIKAEWGIESRQ